MKYEFKIDQTEMPTASADQLTNEYGAEGWNLVQIYQWEDAWYYVFSRPITN